MKNFNITFLNKESKLIKGIFKSKDEDTIKEHLENQGFKIIIISSNEQFFSK